MYKKVNDFKKKINKFKNLKTGNPQTDENKVLKPKVLDNVADFLMNCITFTRTNTMKKKMVQIQKIKKSYYKKLRLTDDYQYESEDAEKEQQQQQTSKKLDEKESPKNQQKII